MHINLPREGSGEKDGLEEMLPLPRARAFSYLAGSYVKECGWSAKEGKSPSLLICVALGLPPEVFTDDRELSLGTARDVSN